MTDWGGAIVALHVFFTEWFAGRLPDTAEAFAPVAVALDPGFTIVAPGGEETDRDGILEFLRGAHGTARGGPSISIDDVRVIHELPPYATVRYIEIQEWDDGRHTERVSTALLESAPSAPHGVRWHTVHETWLPDHRP